MPAALVLVAALVVAGALVGLDRPVPAAFFALLGLVVQSCLPPVVAGAAAADAAPAAPKVPPLVVLLLALALVGCSAADRQIESAVIADAPGVVQLICAGVDGADPSAAKICGPTQTGVSIVSQIVSAVLRGLPAGARKLGADDLAPTTFVLHGCAVTLPKWQADAVKAKYP